MEFSTSDALTFVLLPTIVASQGSPTSPSSKEVDLAHLRAFYWNQKGLFEKAEEHYKLALQSAIKFFGAESVDTASIRGELRHVYFAQGKLKLVEEMFETNMNWCGLANNLN